MTSSAVVIVVPSPASTRSLPAVLAAHAAGTGMRRAAALRHAVRVRSPTQRDVTRDYVSKCVATAFGDDTRVEDAYPLSGGSFGSVWRVDLVDGRRTALKISAAAGARLLTYESGMLAEEANYLRLVADGAPDVPTPRLLFESDDWLFMTLLPGVPLPWLPAGTDTAVVREECGAAFARLHRISGEFFGYTGDRPRATTWPDAFCAMIDALLDDAIAFDVALPVPPAAIHARYAAHRDVLATVSRPALVHFDLWDGNVLATLDDDGAARLSGFVDGERYFYADPLIDFCSPALFDDILAEPGHPFVRGYTSVTPLAIDDAVRRRLALCRLHLYLIMLIEFPSRGKTPENDPDIWHRVRSLVVDLVDGLS
jgi:fructosamine-3-kinase